jgi:hypothetical protein
MPTTTVGIVRDRSTISVSPMPASVPSAALNAHTGGIR